MIVLPCKTTLNGLLLTTISIHFDGSLRYPSDKGFPTRIQNPRAACSASIRLSHPREDTSVDTTFLGGKILKNCSMSTTSGEAEYDGLILALEGLNCLARQSDCEMWLGNCNQSMLMVDMVNIFGDCKTIIHQMSGRSRSRKMISQYNRATELLTEIQTIMPLSQVHFHHIPRTENLLCDRLSTRIIFDQEHQDFRSSINSLQGLLADDKVTSSDALWNYVRSNLGRSSNLVPFSKRPHVYHLLANQFLLINDWHSLVAIGEWWEKELNDVWSKVCDPHDSMVYPKFEIANRYFLLLTYSVRWQLIGLQGLGQRKRLAQLQGKYHHLLRRYGKDTSEGSVDPSHELVSTLTDDDICHHARGEKWPPDVETWIQQKNISATWPLHGFHWVASAQPFHVSPGKAIR